MNEAASIHVETCISGSERVQHYQSVMDGFLRVLIWKHDGGIDGQGSVKDQSDLIQKKSLGLSHMGIRYPPVGGIPQQGLHS